MRLVQDDDTEAFAALFDRLSPRALRVANVICLDREGAQDVVQEAFLSMWRGRSGYRSERAEVQTWAMGIVRNRAIDNLRRNNRHDRRRTGIERADEEQVAARASVERDTIERDEGRRVRAQLGQLPVAQREVVALAYFGQLTHTEIAQHLAVPVGTVKGRMRLGLGKLRERTPA